MELNSIDREVLTVGELAELLRVGKNRAYELVTTKAIPSFRIGSSIRVYRPAVTRWIESQCEFEVGPQLDEDRERS
jgi:DNA binding domain, excisionase family